MASIRANVAGVRMPSLPISRWPAAMFLAKLGGAFAACAAGLVLLEHFDPATSGIFPPCPFRYLTGWYCPGCGSLRAIHQLLHGTAGGMGDESADRGSAAIFDLRIGVVRTL